MIHRKLWFITILASLCWLPTLAVAQADKAYADVILEAYYSHANPRYKYFYGGDGNNYPLIMKPQDVLGNNTKFVSLPKGSYIIVGFTDNTIIDAPHQDDLFIEEVGRAGDQAAVWISADGKKYEYLGRARDDKVTSFDLADIGFKKPVIAVKIMGLDTRGASPGFDLVSIRAMKGAIGSRPSPHLIPRHVYKPPPGPPVPLTPNKEIITQIVTRKNERKTDHFRKALRTSGLRSKLHTLKLKRKKPVSPLTKIILVPKKKVGVIKKKKKKSREAGAESHQL